MVDIRRLFKEYCPLIEEFNVRNIMGGYEQKEWLIASRQTILAGSALALTISTLTGGILSKLDHYYVLAQKLNAAVVNKTFITLKTTAGFTLNGDNAGLYSIIVFGSEVPSLVNKENLMGSPNITSESI